MGWSFSEKDEQRRALMETLFREHYAGVHSFLSNKVRQPDIADDLTSIVFLKAFRWLLEDRGMRQVRSWLYATARTTLADYWQEQRKHIALPLETIEDSAMIPFEPLENEQSQTRVYRLLSLLPVRERQILLLRYLQGYTAAEAGRVLGLSAGHVRVLQLRALRQAALFEREERKYSSMYERDFTYTTQTQRVLTLAKEEALSLKHYYIGPEHLLLGILAEGSAAVSLVEQGTTLVHVRAGLLFLVGKDQGDSAAGMNLTPQSLQVLAWAGQEAQENKETAISPQHILYALQCTECEDGLLQALGVERRSRQVQPVHENRNEQALILEHELVEQYPALTSEEEQQLAYQVKRSEKEKKRAESWNERPNPALIEEGKIASFRLFMANQHLVFSAVKEYVTPGMDVGKLLEAGNRGLMHAIDKFGMKTQVSFHAYATHRVHLEIMESVLD
jgi:RNA polymerase sigma factor (sigma-70 family)